MANSNSLNQTIAQLGRAIGKALAVIAKLLVIIFLGILLLVLRLMPYLLRLACILAWMFGMWWCYSGIYILYLPGAMDYIQVLALFASLACLLVFIPIWSIQNKKNPWSGFLGSGLLGVIIGIITRIADGEQMLLAASVGPTILLGFLIFYILIRFRKTKEVSNE